MKNVFTAFILLTVFAISSLAQEVGVGTDIVSRYVWRGIDFGSSPSIQPYLSFSAGGFEVGSWGAYQLGRDGSSDPADELDLYASYGFDLSDNASLGIVVNDYYFPYSGGSKLVIDQTKGEASLNDAVGAKFGNYGDPGNHTIEAGVSLAISDLSISGYMNLYNDDDNTAYFEVAYSTALNDVGLDFAVGATPGGDTMYYLTDSFNVINMSITASKEIKITEDFSLPIFGSYILNPNTEIAHFVFGISL